jgi:hypothetical protein
MFLAVLLLFTGLTISSVAIYYSVIGMAAIFSAAPIPIYIMGTTLEIAKLVGASWLKAYWHKAPSFIKSYMTIAILVLMMITSMGIFGFLSKAHSDQNLVSGDVVDKIAILDEKIKTQKENIDAARKALKQMDESVDQTVARSTSEKSVGRAVDIRRAQNKERGLLRTEIETAQKELARLNEERAPISKDLRKVEAEVGPIKYIAAFVYGDNPDQNVLEKAVTWVIIMIVIVFDPLAVIMLIAAQMTFSWRNPIQQEEIKILQPVNVEIQEPVAIEEPIFVEEPIIEIPVVEEVFESSDYDELNIKPVDLLYSEYAKDKFEGIIVDPIKEPELASFIEQNKDKARFNNYSQDILKYYARRIYELRKNNSNNTSR